MREGLIFAYPGSRGKIPFLEGGGYGFLTTSPQFTTGTVLEEQEPKSCCCSSIGYHPH